MHGSPLARVPRVTNLKPNPKQRKNIENNVFNKTRRPLGVNSGYLGLCM